MAAQARRRPGSPDIEKLEMDPELGMAGIPSKKPAPAPKIPDEVQIPIKGYPRLTMEHPQVQKLMEGFQVRDWGRGRRHRGGAVSLVELQELTQIFKHAVDEFKKFKQMRLRPSEAFLDGYWVAVEILADRMREMIASPSAIDPAIRTALAENRGPFKESMALYREVESLPEGHTAAAAARKTRRTKSKAGRRKTRK